MQDKKPLNSLGKFLKVHLMMRDATLNQAAKQLGLSKYYLYKVVREPVRKLSVDFMQFPEVFNFTEEETAEFNKLCEEYRATRPPLNQSKYYARGPIPARFRPLLDALRENSNNISDEKIEILMTIIKGS